MAVYNEAETVATAIERVLAVDIPDVDVELVVVESNSSDGTRDRSCHATRPTERVRLVLQDAPRGKGAAVREGFRHATGDIILIQDADLEYSVDDYPKLIEPIMRGDVDFTLGSPPRPGSAGARDGRGTRRCAVMNAAHWVFTWFFNVTYGTKLRDPFTMYKVFRSECIEGVEFVADRFDFDWELAGEARPARLHADRDSGRVQRAFLPRRQEGSILPRPAHLDRGMPSVSLLFSPGAASRRTHRRRASRGAISCRAGQRCLDG